MTESTFRLGSIRGISIGIHFTWLFVFGLLAWSLAEGIFKGSLPQWSATNRWGVAVLGSLLLFASVLIHEFSHAIVAQLRGMKVDSITLFIFGGVANIKGEAERPADEFLVAIVGPVTSLVLAGLFWVLSIVGQASVPVFALTGYLATANLLLALFNLIPGFPLDGGRVLRAVLWAITNDARRSLEIAGLVGRVAAYLFIFVGLFQAISGNVIGGLWLIFIGWFLNNAAEGSVRHYLLRTSLRGFRVASIMKQNLIVAGPGISISVLVNDYILGQNVRAVPIVLGDRFLGIVTLTDIKNLPQEEWSSHYVGEVIRRHEELRCVRPEDDLGTAVQIMAEQDLNQLPVIVDGRLVGLLSRSDVIRFLQMRRELGIPSGDSSKSSP